MSESELKNTVSLPYIIYEPIRELLNEKYNEVVEMMKNEKIEKNEK
jgi:hypothetical protein